MKCLIDTNVISELRKGQRCNANVARWYAGVSADDLYLSVLVLGEIRKGIEKSRDPQQAKLLDQWLDQVSVAFADRVLPVDKLVADTWGLMSAKKDFPVIDALLAATAKVHGLTLVTRNIADVAGMGAKTLNPFEA